MPAVDVFEQPDSIRITVEIPGVKPEDVKISLEGNLLTVHGTKRQEAEERNERVHRYERMYGAFEQPAAGTRSSGRHPARVPRTAGRCPPRARCLPRSAE